MGYLKKAFRGTLTILLLGLISYGAGYLIRLFFARELSVAEFGLYNSIFALLSLLTIAKDFGIASALDKFIPEWVVKKEPQKIKFAITYMLSIRFFLSLLISAVLLATAGITAQYIFKVADPILYYLLILNFFIYGYLEVITAVFIGFQNQKYYGLVEVIRSITLIVCSFIFFKYMDGTIVVGISYVLSTVITSILVTFLFIKVFPEFISAKIRYYKEDVKKFWTYGLSITIASIGAKLIGSIDTVLLSFFKGVEAVAHYNVILPTAYTLLIFSAALSTVGMPIVSELVARHKKEQIGIGLAIAHKYSWVVFVPIIIAFALFPTVALSILFGPVYAVEGMSLSILVLGTVLYCISSFNLSVMVGLGRPHVYTIIFLVGGAVNVILNVSLIPFFGIFGAALATTICYAVMLITSHYYLWKELRYIPDFGTLARILIAGAAIVLVALTVDQYVPTPLFVRLAIITVTSSVVYAAALWVLRVIRRDDLKLLPLG